MNMKKVIASVIAGAVAVSAMATSAFAEESVLKTYKSGTDTYEGEFNFTGVLNATSDTTDDAKLANSDISFEITDNATGTDTKYKVTELTIAGTKYTEETDIDLYLNGDGVEKAEGDTFTITTIAIDAGKTVTMKIKATSDTNKTTEKWFDGAKAANVVDNDAGAGGVVAVKHVANGKTNKVTADKVYMAITDKAKDLDEINDTFEGIDATIAAKIGANKGAKLVFKIIDLENADEDDGEDDPTYSQTKDLFADATAQDLAIMLNKTAKLSTAASIDNDAMTVTFDWDSLLKNSNITNAIGEVNTISIVGKNTLVKTYKKDGKDTPKYAIESITVVVPDAAAETEAPTTEAPATEAPADDTTTPADENPKTGAAPVALALIPAALAAVVVAKKRK